MNEQDGQDQQFSLTLSPEPFCTFCLRANPGNVDFYKYVTGGFDELRLSFQSILGDDFQLDNFAVCRPCWSLVQLFQDFRTCCQRANGLVDRIGRGLSRDGNDGWFGEKNVGVIEGVQRMVQDQLAQIKGIEDGGMIKTEPVEVEEMACSVDVGEESKIAGSSQLLSLEKRHDNQEPQFHMVEIKNYTEEFIEDKSSYESTERKTVQVKSNNDLLEEMKQTDQQSLDSEDSKECTQEHKEMDTESEEDEDTDNTSVAKCRRSGLLKCKKCKRKFAKLRCVKLHLLTCNGTAASRILTCNICKATFTEPRLLNTHLNKHEGKTPFQCRKHCTASFVSVQIRNRHEESCSTDRYKCTLCQQNLTTQNRLYEHYRLAHPGELRYPCSSCDKRFKKRHNLLCHERRIHSEHRAKTETCPICGKKFAEINDLKSHIKSIHETAQEDRQKTISCDKCGQQLRGRGSLNMHMAAKHPEGTTAENLEAYERRRVQKRDYKRRRRVKGMKKEEQMSMEMDAEEKT